MGEIARKAFRLMGMEDKEPRTEAENRGANLMQDVAVHGSRKKRKEEMNLLFREAIQEIKTGWIPGLLPHIKKNHDDLWAAIEEGGDRLEKVWVEVLKGDALIEAFEEALMEWKWDHLLAIKKHRRKTCLDCPPDKWKTCMKFWEEKQKALKEGLN